eukprot:TRINITY_DN59650_c0_g1_i1.p1 TRINITY_DN59650_c0_g1~~TRINITY_DN59650_c0_g1_i1.p1  ORF type:complete len:439 (-),score=63.82 TRINITY_DN59650_c0_g1_i1:147-1436(-)
MPAPVAGVNGAWQCVACPNVNFAMREACNRCSTPKPAEQLPPPQQAFGSAPVAGDNGNWQCSVCQNVNFPMREACNRCHTSKEQATYDAAPTWEQGGAQGKGGAGRAPVAGENGNWACASCGNVNFPTREVCNRCQTPKVVESPRGSAPVAGENGNWACPSCQNVNFPARLACNRCQMPRPEESSNYSAASPRIAQRAGAWSCHTCQNVNVAVCNRCQTPQVQGSAEEVGELHNLLAQRDRQLRERDHKIAALEAALDQQLFQQEVADWGGATKGGAPVAGVDGNWQCPSCQNVNFAVRDACNRCKMPRPAAHPRAPSGAPVAGVNGNWLCSQCQNVNFAVRDACNKCAAPRSTAELAPSNGGGKAGSKGRAPVPGENGNWFCQGCGNVNFPMRDMCNRCQSPKPAEEFDESDQSLMDELLQPAKRARS